MEKLAQAEKPVLIVSPDFPPRKGGVADHTYRLALSLKDKFNVRVLTSKYCDELDELHVFPAVYDWHEAEEIYNQIIYLSKKCRVIWQYVPHMYGRGGVNSAIPEVVEMLAETQTRQMMIAHEIFAPMSWLPHRAKYALSQRSQWKKISRHMERIGISAQAWIDRGWGVTPQNHDAYELCPSPSGIPLQKIEKDHKVHWKMDHGLSADTMIIGFFGMPGPGKQFDWVVDAWRDVQKSHKEVALVCIGKEPDFEPDSSLKSLYVPTGYLEPEDVSKALHAVDVMALPYELGVSEKRTSFTGSLQHGLPIVTTHGDETSDQLRQCKAFVSCEAGDRGAFSNLVTHLIQEDTAREALRPLASKYYSSNLSWEHVAGKIEDWIKHPRKVQFK